MISKNPFVVRLNQYLLRASRTLRFLKKQKGYIGEDSLNNINHILLDKKYQVHNVFIVTDIEVSQSSMMKFAPNILGKNGITYNIYIANSDGATKENIESGLMAYKERKCEAILAIGNDSVIDTAKLIGAKIANPKMRLEDMEGINKLKKGFRLLIAVPTVTSGSESSIYAVVTDTNRGLRYTINDPKIMPDYYILDPNCLYQQDSVIIGYNGMDVLIHSIEAYISKGFSKKGEDYASHACRLIHENIEIVANKNGVNNIKARENILYASYLSGLASSYSYLGLCHAITEAIAGKYNLSFGEVGIYVLPYVLLCYGSYATRQLANLADEIKYFSNKTSLEKAEWVIDRLRSLRKYLDIKNKLSSLIKDEDIQYIAEKAYAEYVMQYPIPKYVTLDEIRTIIKDAKNDKN